MVSDEGHEQTGQEPKGEKPKQHREEPKEALRKEQRHSYIEWATLIAAFGALLFTGLQWWEMRKTLALDQRPWVGVMQYSDPEVKRTRRTEFTVTITNTGKTPALKATSRMLEKRLRFEDKFSPVYDGTETTRNIGVVQPGMRLFLSHRPSEELNDTAISILEDGGVITYVYGEIIYYDIFREEHRTTFCGILQTDLTTVDSCDTYNDAT